ncbi:hypothetical protein PIB30_068321 [Stylosanthes scabra]|uniref:Uncharacterized protein n=1 Tax=Stylosanthes scabra TaxID=79078 RepID=A0ABU6TPG8_9FABA|nr:hypothetical protein [Stylosanthes scabra]
MWTLLSLETPPAPSKKERASPETFRRRAAVIEFSGRCRHCMWLPGVAAASAGVIAALFICSSYDAQQGLSQPPYNIQAHEDEIMAYLLGYQIPKQCCRMDITMESHNLEVVHSIREEEDKQ